MPYMSGKLKKQFEKTLADKKSKLLKKDLAQDSADVPFQDYGFPTLLSELGLLNITRDSHPLSHEQQHEVDEVNGALLRLMEGTFGTCEECYGEISMGHLRLHPESRYCDRCSMMFYHERARRSRYEEAQHA